MPKISSEILKAALNASGEFRNSVGNVSVDNGVGADHALRGSDEVSDEFNAFWTDAAAANEVLYVYSTFNESGHANNEDLHGPDSSVRLSMANQRRNLNRVIERFKIKSTD